MGGHRTLKAMAVVGVLGIAVGTSSAWASHSFVDVPDSHPFHDEIAAVAGAGITTGFPDGGYHPDAGITRQAEAAFMTRGLSRASSKHVLGTFLGDGSQHTTSEMVFESPSPASTGTGYLEVTTSTLLDATTAAGCPCTIEVSLFLNGSMYLTPWSVHMDGNSSANVVRSSVVPLYANSSATIAVGLKRTQGSTMIAGTSDITAIYVPFEESAGAG